MKKIMYLLPVAALAMASCSNDDNAGIEQSVQQLATADQLMIRPAVGGASTRIAGYQSIQDLDKFYLDITGAFKTGENGTDQVNVISKELVNTNSFALYAADNTSLYYWKDKDTKATFSAYAPTTIDWTQPITIDTDRSKQVDYMVAYNEGVKSDFRSGVPLNFQHVTSQINVLATNKDYDKVNISVRAIRFTNIRNKGVLSKPAVSTVNGIFSWENYKPWSVNDASNVTFLTQFNDDENLPAITLSANAQNIMFGDNHYLLPQQLTAATAPEITDLDAYQWTTPVEANALAFLIKVTDVNGTAIYPTQSAMDAQTSSVTGYAWAYVPVETNWEPGKKYIYTVNFAKDAYGKVDPDQVPGGTDDPNDGNEPQDKPGEDVVVTEVPLTFTVTVEDWIDVNEAKNL